ncbi:hypothetical protein IGI37_003792 [Enterococcus sp. AZ194]|uniref:hypothetical protein n=1 Tax=Enterococcus sp. AZ194 TaxID=2774629 RepID=UPI003F244712
MFPSDETKLNKAADYIILGGLILLFSLPLFTIMPVYIAVLGLYLQKNDDRIYVAFFENLKKFFFKGLLLESLLIFSMLIYYLNASLEPLLQKNWYVLLRGASTFYLLLILFAVLQATIGMYLGFPKLNRALLSKCLALSLIRLPQMCLLTFLLLGALVVLTKFPFMLLFVPIGLGFFHTKLVYPGWKKYGLTK